MLSFTQDFQMVFKSMYRLFFFFSMGCALSSCASNLWVGKVAITPVAQPPEGKFLFVEIWVKTDGTGTLPEWRIDRPTSTYLFDKTARILSLSYQKDNYPYGNGFHDWGLLGYGQSRFGSAGEGIAGGLVTISTIPFTTTISVSNGQVGEYSEEMVSLPVEFLVVSADGKLSVKVEDEIVLLEIGESWSRIVDAEIHNDQYDGEFKVTSTLSNYGWLDLSQILRP